MRKRRRRRIPRIEWGKVFDIVGLSVIAVMLIAGISVSLAGDKPVGAQVSDNPDVHIDIELVENDTDITLYNVQERRNETLALETYVCHCLAAEMPALYNAEALKANAVAIRTVIVERLATGAGCSARLGADVCSDPLHCQGYASLEQLKIKWGEHFDEYYGKLKKCVIETAGQILIYNNAPIKAYYHSNSVSMTEDCVNVFNASYPYLQSVESPTDTGAEYYQASVSYSLESFVSLVNSRYPQARLSVVSLRDTVRVASRFKSGRVNKLALGTIEISGVEARELFELKSANFTVGFSGELVVLDTLGSGHGVGLSQVGADVLADSGKSYAEILTHYYIGTTVDSMEKFIV